MTGIEILERIIDSKDFTVGGGSAAALAGAMAAGLAGMVARLSVGKDYGLCDDKYDEIAKDADGLAKGLLSGAGKDTEAFCKIKQAYCLPKGTPDEKAKRSQAIEEAAIGAASVPEANARLCQRVRELIKTLEGKSNPGAGSDLDEARLLVNAALLGCVLNMKANLPLIKNEEIKLEFIEKIKMFRVYSNNII